MAFVCTLRVVLRLIGCDICDAFNVSNGFPTEEKLAEHTALVHGPVRERDEKSLPKKWKH